jgi:hypothetical protein
MPEMAKWSIGILTGAAMALSAIPALGDQVQTRIGTLELNAQGLPSQASVEKLFDEFDFQRATQSYLWGLPIVAFAVWQKAHEDVFGAKDGDIVVYSDFKARQGILTANATTPYIMSFFDTSRTGPVVIDFPGGELAGGVGDFWQRNLSDMGETGPDKGKGARYLILGPNQKAPADAKGYYVVHSPTFNVFFGFRVLTTDEGKAKTITDDLKLYPYSKRAAPPPTHIVTPHNQTWSGTQPEGMAYWRALNEILQKEPVQERDRYFMAMLRPLGIDKGKPFAPDARQTKLLTDGAFIGQKIAIANSFDKRFAGSPYRAGVHWDHVVNVDPSQEAKYYSELDERSAWFYEAVTLSAGMASKVAGLGQAYLGSYQDKDGNWFDGSKTYHLHVPPHPPAKQFWSVTLYDTATRRFLDTPEQRADRSSRQDLVKNDDGSVDLYFGPKPPDGKPQPNWIPTVPGKGWFAYLRLYGPLEPYLDGTWPLPDIEPVLGGAG